MKPIQPPQLLGSLLVLASTCCFVLVIAYKWVMLALPSSGWVPFFVAGLVVVGGVLGFVVCAGANLLLRLGPPKLRVPLSALIWVVLVALSLKMLLDSGSDTQRTFVAAAIMLPSGLLIGPYWGETIVGAWFLKRILAARDAKLTQIKRDHDRTLEEIHVQSLARRKAEQDARFNEQERSQAIRSYFRS